MAKLIELSILFAIIVIPARAARERDAAVGFKKALIQIIGFNLLYLFLLLFVHGRLAG